MIKQLFLATSLICGSLCSEPVQQPQEEQSHDCILLSAEFNPPEGWRFADSKSLPKHVKIMVVGKGARELPPSINLGYEEFSGTLKDYLKIIKDFNASQGDTWKDLGMVQTEAGPASLSQVEMKTQWGDVRQMHVVYLENGMIYILTAAALKDEFSKFYPDFFKSLRSFRLGKKPISKSVQAQINGKT